MHSYRVPLAMILKSVFSLKKIGICQKNFKKKNIFKTLKNYILENHLYCFLISTLSKKIFSLKILQIKLLSNTLNIMLKQTLLKGL